jgi:murein L,D-transpeptidase YcbB/YkuD
MAYRLLQVIITICLFVACNATYQPASKIKSIREGEQEASMHKAHKYLYPVDSVSTYIPTVINYFADADSKQLDSFYAQNKYCPVWISDSIINSGFQLILSARFHGLNPNEYRAVIIDSLFRAWEKDRSNYSVLAKLDAQLTLSVRKFSEHLLTGKLNPKDFHGSWNYKKRRLENKDSLLLHFIQAGRINEIEPFFASKNLSYQGLSQALRELYQEQNTIEDWVVIKYPEFIVSYGDSNKYVAELKQRLGVTDSLPWKYTQELNDSIKSFQTSHGLRADGKPGRKTYEFLAWSCSRYIDALKVNMERLRWLPDSIETNGLLVNIPAYQLQLNKSDSIYFNTKTIVGKPENETPVFQSKIDYLVFNPCWTVPNSIALDKMLPRIKTDSLYLQNRNMFIGLNGIEQNTDSVDFMHYSKANFPFKIYQRTGPGNALGKVKFMFANTYSIYLHDTPNKNLFNRDARALSQGCVRVQNAMNLAHVMLYKWDDHAKPIAYYLKKAYPIKVYLKKYVPISLLYLTCSYDFNAKQVFYYKDIYAKDYKVLMALEKIE